MPNTTKEVRQYTKKEKEDIKNYLKKRGISDLKIAYFLIRKEDGRIAAFPRENKLERAFMFAQTDDINRLLASISRIEFGTKIGKFNKRYCLFTRSQPHRTNSGNLTRIKKKKPTQKK